MNSKHNKDEIWKKVGFIKVSSKRYTILKTLKNNHLIPSEIAKQTELTPSQVSSCLHDLKKENLVRCLNEDKRKGRIYHTTELGLQVLEKLEENEYHPET